MGGGVERTPRTKASVEVVGAGGFATGGGTEAVAVGANVVALMSAMGTVGVKTGGSRVGGPELCV